MLNDIFYVILCYYHSIPIPNYTKKPKEGQEDQECNGQDQSVCMCVNILYVLTLAVYSISHDFLTYFEREEASLHRILEIGGEEGKIHETLRRKGELNMYSTCLTWKLVV